LVRLPESVGFVTAASLGCRFATSFRAIVHQGRVAAGDWIAVHGCGGVGLSAVMIGRAVGAQVIAVDIQPARLSAARRLGASETIDASQHEVVARIRQITGRGVQVSLDALGSQLTCWNSIQCLAKHGRHVQIGLMLGSQADPPIPMSEIIGKELELYGSHGMQAFEYDRMLQMIAAGQLKPDELISDVINLNQGAELLTRMDQFPNPGITVIEM
jgi:alcohol dehydrogenase